MKMKTIVPKFLGCSKSSSKREVYSDTGLPQQIRKFWELLYIWKIYSVFTWMKIFSNYYIYYTL